ncbi:MAG TPA: hypothetical protein VGO13_11140 [Solirubrobacterales bacterium]|jgi:hypothetical protein|nr:hypothetical protein [Solirubrobacterales bacterium]
MSRRLLIPVLLILASLLGAGLARAELSQSGNVRISFSGDFSPHALPRDRPAPVSIDVQGAIGTTDGSHPPAVRKIEIAINRHGLLSTQGLPACSSPLLQSTSTETALKRCRPALVGRGSFEANVAFPSATPVLATGTMLAFYGRSNGKQALFLHLYAKAPVHATFILPLTISHNGNQLFGTILSAKIPTLAGGIGSVTKVDLRIGRNYSYRGQRRSFISASCPAPAGFTGASFSLARGSFYFADGKKIETTLSRACKVR